MVTIDITLLTGRYHATPWGRGVNEGAVEWPPSPWRLVRALIAVWHRNGHVQDEAIVRELCIALSNEAPCFELPPAAVGHTRHYLPQYTLDKDTGYGKTSKVIDAFVHAGIGQGQLRSGVKFSGSKLATIRMTWPNAELNETQAVVLNELVTSVPYFGRAESWIEATLWTSAPPNLEIDNLDIVLPLVPGTVPVGDVVDVLCPRPIADFNAWREQTVNAALVSARAQEPAGKTERATQKSAERKAQRAMKKVLPIDFFAALHADTTELLQQGWSLPPGAYQVAYERPRDCLQGRPSRRRPAAPAVLPTTARFVLDSTVPPRITDAIRFCERVHTKLVQLSHGSPVFTGQASPGIQLEGHQHAYLLPEARDRNGGPPGAIDGLVIHAAMGFDERAQRALHRLGVLNRRSGHNWHLALEALGGVDEIAARGHGTAGAVALHSGRRWRSVTPFVPTRSIKRRRNGKPRLNATGLVLGGPEHDLRRLIELAGLPELVEVIPLADTRLGGRRAVEHLPGGKRVSWLEFSTRRAPHKAKSGSRGAARGYGFEVCFAQPVDGPLVLGFGAHLGLGIFEPIGD